MNMKTLLADFTKYVDNMSDEDIRNSIAEAVLHSENSDMLNSNLDEMAYNKVSDLKHTDVCRVNRAYSFSSVASDLVYQKFSLVRKAGTAA